MTQVLSHLSQDQSRLVQFLVDIGQQNPDIATINFTEKLGQLIDFSDAFALSDTLKTLTKLPLSTESDSKDNIMAKVFEERGRLVESILKSFKPDANSFAFKLPMVGQDDLLEGGQALESYQRFYALHQSEMDYDIQKLRQWVRKMMASYSQRLAQLSRLDEALAGTLASHNRQVFAVIPQLLASRFEYLRTSDSANAEENDVHAQPGQWLNQFYQDMQGLLLAELDIRLQPVFGLIEALDQEVKDS